MLGETVQDVKQYTGMRDGCRWLTTCPPEPCCLGPCPCCVTQLTIQLWGSHLTFLSFRFPIHKTEIIAESPSQGYYEGSICA